jgi:hypothetical protein
VAAMVPHVEKSVLALKASGVADRTGLGVCARTCNFLHFGRKWLSGKGFEAVDFSGWAIDLREVLS